MDSREKERAEGWGWIGASASIIIAWGIVAALGHNPNVGLTFGSLGLGIWKVLKR